MVNRYWRQLRSKLFSGHRLSLRAKISPDRSAGSGERGKDVFDEEEGRAAGRPRRVWPEMQPAPRPWRAARPPRSPEMFPGSRGCCALVSWCRVMNQLPSRTTPTPAMQPGSQDTGNCSKDLILFISLSVLPSQVGWRRKHPAEVSEGRRDKYLSYS